jgi:hypothetical protein
MKTLDEAIKHCEEVAEKNERQASYFHNKEGNPFYEDCIKCAKEHRQLAEWLRELEQLRKQTKWVPVSERLPKERGVYIVTEKVFSVTDKEHTGRFNLMTEQAEFDNGKWRRASFYEVIAWKPLLKPYQEEKVEG